MLETSSLFRLLGDDVRIRLLRLLATERLNVSELTDILGIAQSGVSRHLGLLRDAGLVREHREGGFTYYGAAGDAGGRFDQLWPAVRDQLAAESGRAGLELRRVLDGDDARLAEVKRQRRELRDTHALGGNGSPRQLVPGRSWAAWSRALGLILDAPVVADLGCGDGRLTLEVAGWAETVYGVDRSAAVLREARTLARRRGVGNVVWKRGEIEALPLDDASVDLAVLSQALHHAETPAVALAEAARVVRPGGRVLVLDLDRHDEQWVTERLGDRWLGFAPETLHEMMTRVGLRDVRVESGLDQAPFTVLVAVGVQPRRRAAGPRAPRATPGGRASKAGARGAKG